MTFSNTSFEGFSLLTLSISTKKAMIFPDDGLYQKTLARRQEV